MVVVVKPGHLIFFMVAVTQRPCLEAGKAACGYCSRSAETSSGIDLWSSKRRWCSCSHCSSPHQDPLIAPWYLFLICEHSCKISEVPYSLPFFFTTYMYLFLQSSLSLASVSMRLDSFTGLLCLLVHSDEYSETNLRCYLEPFVSSQSGSGNLSLLTVPLSSLYMQVL